MEVILFGPIEKAVANGDKRFLPWLEKLKELGKLPTACKRIAELEGFELSLQKYTRVEYVGKMIAEYMEKGYIPMTF